MIGVREGVRWVRPVSRRTVISRLLDELHSPVFVVSRDHKITYANAALGRWLELAPDTISGLDCRYSAESDSPAAGLCPPPEVFSVGTGSASVWRALADGSTESRRARFVALDPACEHPSHVLAVVDPEPESAPTSRDDLASAAPGKSSLITSSTDLHAKLWQLRGAIADQYRIEQLIGQTPAMQRVQQLVRAAVNHPGNVIILGKEGTGREHVARTVHQSSAGDAGPPSPMAVVGSLTPLATLACPVLDTELLEATVSTFLQRCAELEMPRLPMLLLLDVDQLEASVQETLFGLLSVHELELRCVSTARQSLMQCAREHDYHAGLAHALSSLEIDLPPLSERTEDIPLLVQHFVQRWNLDAESQIQGFTEEAIGHFLVYPWSTHVRELKELVYEACAAAKRTTVGIDSLPFALRAGLDAALYAKQEHTPVALERVLEGVEIKAITEALRLANGNRAQAARMLEISRARLLRRMEHLGLGESESGSSERHTE